ncbi:adenosine receptor A2b-like [Argopecten irradians]|uniref:adenosine receptor A2b-like n=1 Tax=Argopecten irradians TaxID=31199 RepID=UPI003718939C
MNNSTGNISEIAGAGAVGSVIVTFQVAVMVPIITGNILVLIAYKKVRRLQTVTGKFVSNLAVSDLLLGFILPFQIAFFIYPEMEKNKYICLMRFQSIKFASTTSLFSLVCTVVDRFIAIIKPLQYHNIMLNKTCYILVVSSWVYSTVLTSMPFFGLNTWSQAPFCLYELVLSGTYRFFFAVHTIFFSFIMFIIYIKIFLVAWYHQKRIRAEEVPMSSHSDSRQVHVMALVVASFTLAWLPFCIIQILQVFNFSVDKAIAGNFAVFLGIANSTTNPVIYVWKNKEFRKTFREIICCKTPSQDQNEMHYHTNVESTDI